MSNFTSSDLQEDTTETRVLRVCQLCLPYWQHKYYRQQYFTVKSTGRTFLNTITRPNLFTDAACGVKWFGNCCLGPGNDNDRGRTAAAMQDRTCQIQHLPTSSHPDKGGKHGLPWIRWLLRRVWGQRSLTHHGVPNFLVWWQTLIVHHGPAAQLIRASHTRNPRRSLQG